MRDTVMIAVRAAFWLKGCLTLHGRRSKTAKHVFDNVIRPDPKGVALDLGRHMTIAEVPCEPYELMRLWVRDVDDRLGRRANDEPRPVLELNAVSIDHRDRRGQIEQYLVALIADQADAPTVAMIEIERDRAGCKVLRPFTCASVHGRPLRHSSHINRGSSVVPWAAPTQVHR